MKKQIESTVATEMPKIFMRPNREPAALNSADAPFALPVGALFCTVEVVVA